MKRLRLDKRGVSNVIVVMLSLVLIVIVVANVILWSYQMNQLDWERMQEKVTISNVEQITRSTWFTARNEYTVGVGKWIVGTYTDTWAVNGTYETFMEALVPLTYSPTAYALGGATRIVSGTTADLAATDDAYMVFRSYSSAFDSRTLYTHQETTTIAGAPYFQLRTNGSDAAGQNRDAPISTTGRNLWGRFVYPLAGCTEIPASVWTAFYRANKTEPLPVVHCDLDIAIRKTDGTIRTTIATDVADSPNLSNSWNTVSATYSWNSYTVVDESDCLEVAICAHVTVSQSGSNAYLRIDDSSLATNLQTRIENIMLPSAYAVQIELSGSSDAKDWESLTWTTENAFTTNSVNVTLQLYNFNSSSYPTSGDGYIAYVSNPTPSTDETQNQTIASNPAQYRNATGGWRARVTAVKAATSQFDLRNDWVEFKVTSQDSHRLNLTGEFKIDLSTYQRTYVKSIEIQIRYRANDSIEKWFLKAYNWTKEDYDDKGFNTTAGNTPVSNFGCYSVNLTSAWQSYVQTDGTMRVLFCDLAPDSNQTTTDVDFLGVRAVIEGVKLSLKNEGSVTCHVVAIWIVNSTRHERYKTDFYLNSGTNADYVKAGITLPSDTSIVKIITERGNTAVFRKG